MLTAIVYLYIGGIICAIPGVYDDEEYGLEWYEKVNAVLLWPVAWVDWALFDNGDDE